MTRAMCYTRYTCSRTRRDVVGGGGLLRAGGGRCELTTTSHKYHSVALSHYHITYKYDWQGTVISTTIGCNVNILDYKNPSEALKCISETSTQQLTKPRSRCNFLKVFYISILNTSRELGRIRFSIIMIFDKKLINLSHLQCAYFKVNMSVKNESCYNLKPSIL